MIIQNNISQIQIIKNILNIDIDYVLYFFQITNIFIDLFV